MIDIAAVVGGFAGVGPLSGLADCWTWSPADQFSYAIALSDDGDHAFQINCRGPLDADLVVSVLSFAREHTAQALTAAPLAAIGGYSPPPASAAAAFDTIAAAAPAAHRHQRLKHPDLRVTCAVFPA